LAAGPSGEEDGFKLWQSLVRQTELTAQLCSITKDLRNVRGNTQKKTEKLRQLLSGLLSELTYFEEVVQQPEVPFPLSISFYKLLKWHALHFTVLFYLNYN
jgi:phosphatidylinositol 3-kinase